MKVRTRTLVAGAVVLGIAAGPAVAYAAPMSEAVSVPAPTGAMTPPLYTTAPDAAALSRAIAGVGPDNKDATAALVRVGGTSGRWVGSSGVADVRTGRKAFDDARFGRAP